MQNEPVQLSVKMPIGKYRILSIHIMYLFDVLGTLPYVFSKHLVHGAKPFKKKTSYIKSHL